MLANEQAWRTEFDVRGGLRHVWEVMQNCVQRGCSTEVILPGGLKVKRRAPGLLRKLQADSTLNQVVNADEDGMVPFLLTAGAIGILYKENASILGVDFRCQGEVGSACSMAWAR